jgi:putative two-component system response regulator
MPTDSADNLLTTATPILVVDDEALVRDLVARWLAHEHYQCAQAANAQAAWEYLQAHEVHLVTLDVRMPGQSGTELLSRIAKTFPDTAIIMMTAQDDTQTAIDALTHGACAYLLKPVKREELVFQARRALERRQLILDNREYLHHLEIRVREQTAAIRRAQEETIHRLLSASLWHDEETGMHIRRVGLMSERLAKAVGWSDAEAENIRLAAPMHDIGKIGIPDAILCKPGPLTPEELQIMRKHAVIGAKILTASASPMLQMAEEIAIKHHEHWDGGGYPAGLSSYAIPESARIVAIVDVFDALTHDRVYRPAMPEEKVLDRLQQGMGTHFDPHLLAIFFLHLAEMTRICDENPDESPASLTLPPLAAGASEAISEPFDALMGRKDWI